MPVDVPRSRSELGSVGHGLRLFGSALVAALLAGAVAGAGSRVAMWVLRWTNASHNGEVTHDNAVIGRFTMEGVVSLVVNGMFLGVPAALLYLLVRRWLPGRGWRKGIAFGMFLLVVGVQGITVEDENRYEYVRFASPLVSVPLFALLLPLYGVIAATLTERLGAGAQGPPRNRALAVVGRALLAAVVVVVGWSDWQALRAAFGSQV